MELEGASALPAQLVSVEPERPGVPTDLVKLNRDQLYRVCILAKLKSPAAVYAFLQTEDHGRSQREVLERELGLSESRRRRICEEICNAIDAVLAEQGNSDELALHSGSKQRRARKARSTQQTEQGVSQPQATQTNPEGVQAEEL